VIRRGWRAPRPVRFESLPLLLDPPLETAGEGPCFAHRSPARQGDADATVLPDRNHVTPRTRMTHENGSGIDAPSFERVQRCQGFQGCRVRLGRVEREARLHAVTRLQLLDHVAFLDVVERKAVGELACLQHPGHTVDGLQGGNVLHGVSGLQIFELARLHQHVALE